MDPPALSPAERPGRAQWLAALQPHPPFSQMQPAHIEQLLDAATLLRCVPGQVLRRPEDGPVHTLYAVLAGAVTGRRGLADLEATGFQYEGGDVFPVGALMGARPVTATYTATEPGWCLLIPREAVDAVASASPPFAGYLGGRILQYLTLSRRAVQADAASQTLAEQSFETALGHLVRRQPVTCRPDTPLAEALRTMHDQHIGSLLVTDAAGCLQGILTRQDVLGRVALAQRPLSTPVAEVMTRPVHTLAAHDTAQDAALMMSRHGIRHVPVLDGERLVGLVSERDLFALQRLSLKQLSSDLRHARDLAALRSAAPDIRRFARSLLAQGLCARQLTELVSHLNDVLTARLVHLMAQAHGLDMDRACWIALGSEGRGEQTIATDQDNGLVFDSDDPDRDRARWLAFAKDVNEGLAACGYPLCQGGVMAMNPQWCLTPREWCARFDHWIEHGAPEDLLHASIFFDFRALAGQGALLDPMRQLVHRRARAVPRFLRQMSELALRHRVPLNWLGGLDTTREGAHEWVDLKMQGAALFVAAARIYALAHGVTATGTRARIEQAAPAMGVEPQESQAWIAGFEFLQTLRLRVQIGADEMPAQPNRLDVTQLNDIDRRMLKETFRLARRLQQRLELDYLRS